MSKMGQQDLFSRIGKAIKPTYYNTTGESNPELKEYTDKAQSQDEELLKIVRAMDRPFTSADIYRKTRWEKSSVARSMNTLKKAGKIEETGNKVKGIHNRNILEYRLC